MSKLEEPVLVNHYPHKDNWENNPELADAQTSLTDVTEHPKQGILVWASDGKTFWKTGVKDGKLSHVKGPYTLPSGRVSPKASEPNIELVYGIAEALEMAHGEEVEIDWDDLRVVGPRGLETFDFENDPELLQKMQKLQEKLDRRYGNSFVDALTSEVSGLMSIPGRFRKGQKERFEELNSKVGISDLDKEYQPGKPELSPMKDRDLEPIEIDKNSRPELADRDIAQEPAAQTVEEQDLESLDGSHFRW